MTFPIWYILVPWSAILFFAALFLFFNVFHLLRYGIEPGKTYSIIGAYLGSFALILLGSAVLFLQFDWKYEVSPSDLLPINSEATSTFGL